MKLVVIESPFAAHTLEGLEHNQRYLRAAMLDCMARGEAPFVSHLLYTQVLDDKIQAERKAGMLMGFAWAARGDLRAIYVDLGVSEGMLRGVEHAHEIGQPVEERRLIGWS